MIEQRIADVVARHTRDIADFPSPGVVFKDLTPLFADPAAFGQVLDLLAAARATVTARRIRRRRTSRGTASRFL